MTKSGLKTWANDGVIKALDVFADAGISVTGLVLSPESHDAVTEALVNETPTKNILAGEPAGYRLHVFMYRGHGVELIRG